MFRSHIELIKYITFFYQFQSSLVTDRFLLIIHQQPWVTNNGFQYDTKLSNYQPYKDNIVEVSQRIIKSIDTKKKKRPQGTYIYGNPGHGLGQVPTCGCVKPVWDPIFIYFFKVNVLNNHNIYKSFDQILIMLSRFTIQTNLYIMVIEGNL